MTHEAPRKTPFGFELYLLRYRKFRYPSIDTPRENTFSPWGENLLTACAAPDYSKVRKLRPTRAPRLHIPR